MVGLRNMMPATFLAQCEVWVAPPQDVTDEHFGNYVCEVYPNGYVAYRSEAVDRQTGEPVYDPGSFNNERIGWVPD